MHKTKSWAILHVFKSFCKSLEGGGQSFKVLKGGPLA